MAAIKLFSQYSHNRNVLCAKQCRGVWAAPAHSRLFGLDGRKSGRSFCRIATGYRYNVTKAWRSRDRIFCAGSRKSCRRCLTGIPRYDAFFGQRLEVQISVLVVNKRPSGVVYVPPRSGKRSTPKSSRLGHSWSVLRAAGPERDGLWGCLSRVRKGGSRILYMNYHTSRQEADAGDLPVE